MNKKLLFIAAISSLLFAAPCCTPEEQPKDDKTEQEEKPGEGNQEEIDPTPEPEPEKDLETPIPYNSKYKVATLWIDANANVKRLNSKEKALRILDKIQEAGFNAIVLDVKPINGYSLFDSEILTRATSLGGQDLTKYDYDYLPFFIEECKKREMRITVSMCIMPMGHNDNPTDPSFTDPYWDDKYCVENLPKGLVDIREDHDSGIFAFLQQANPAVHDFVISFVTELVTKFDFDGFALDYCRFQDYNSDFSPAAREDFERYIGQTVQNWPDDIYYYLSPDADRGEIQPGPLFKDWIEYRSDLIKKYVQDIRAAVKAVKPNLDLEMWASAWWPCWSSGQNWASAAKDKTSTYWWASKNYYKTGLASDLDIFQLGAYTSKLNGTGTDSIEGLIDQGKLLIRKECQMYGTISAATSYSFKMADACYMCLDKTDGLMVFDLSHVDSNNWWPKIKAGIMRYRNEKEK